jgi:4-amino-4-deoxy-L-arabinose transferase-like glycosyltransferase
MVRLGADARGRAQHAIPAALLIVAAGLRCSTLGTQSLWTDEGQTVMWLHGSFAHMLSAVANNESSPPLYFCLAWLWSKVFGDWIVALRALSALLGCATVLVAYYGLRPIWGQRVAAVLGLLAATSAMLVWYSQEARPYALLLLLCTLSLVFLARLLVLGDERSIGWWALAAGLALATHYFAAFLIAPQAALIIARAPRTRRVAAAFAGLAVVVAAIVPFALYQHRLASKAWSAIAATGSLRSRLQAALGRLLVNGGAGVPHAWWLGYLFVAAAFAVALWRGSAVERRTVALGAGLAAAVIILALIAALAGFDYVLARHLLPAYLPLLGALAVALGGSRAGRIGLLVAAAGAVLGVAVTISVDTSLTYQREDVRDVARPLAAHAPGRTVIIQRSDNYLLRSHGLPALLYYAPTLRAMPAGARPVQRLTLIEEGVSPANVIATISRLRLLGFKSVTYQARQVFVTYQLRAPSAIALTRGVLARDARFGSAAPLLLVN